MDSNEGRGVKMDGREVRRRRKLMGEERNTFAAQVGISPGYLSLLECNNRNPSPTIFGRICDALGVREDERECLTAAGERVIDG